MLGACLPPPQKKTVLQFLGKFEARNIIKPANVLTKVIDRNREVSMLFCLSIFSPYSLDLKPSDIVSNLINSLHNS